MRMFRQRLTREEGFTLLEVMLSVIIMSIMILGLTIVLLAFKEHLDRSWAIRVMDQYGNDVVERLTHELRNSVDVTVRNGPQNTHQIELKYLDPVLKNKFRNIRWEADLRGSRILLDRKPVDPTFPPLDLGRGESFQIVSFTLTPFGTLTGNTSWEHREMNQRSSEFNTAAWDIHFTLRYNRAAVGSRDRSWVFEKQYFNRVYVRNANLAIKKGITGSE